MNSRSMTQAMCLFLFLIFLVAATSCRTPAGRTAGEVVDDATITSKVKAKLLDDPLTKGLSINVDTFEGNVSLTGAVASEQEKRRAMELARSVAGVKSVKETLTMKTR